MEHQHSLNDFLFSAPDQAKYYCRRCEGWYLDEETLIEHTNLYHEYWCVMCNLQIKSENELKQHMNIHCGRSRCDFCRIIFRTTESTLKHMLTKHSEIKDKFVSVNSPEKHKTPSRSPSSLHIYSPNTINNRVQSNGMENLVAAPVILPRQPISNNFATKNGQYHSIQKNHSTYLCEKCNLKFTDIQETAKHMMSRHKVKIGIRTFRGTGKEEIFIIGNEGKILDMGKRQPPNQNNNHSNPVDLDGGKTTLTITTTQEPVSSTSNGQQLLQSSTSVYGNGSSTPILPTGSIISSVQLPRLTKFVPSSTAKGNRLTLINSNNINKTVSQEQNGSSPQPSLNNSKSKPRAKNPQHCEHCDKELSSKFSLNRHLSVILCFLNAHNILT